MKRKTISEIDDIVVNLGGTLLSSFYKNYKTKLTVRCKCGLSWETCYKNLRRGNFCRRCSNKGKVTLDTCQKKASGLDGYCLSLEYINARTKLIWSCKNGHEWMSSYDRVRRGAWCTRCTSTISEEICRVLFEEYFEKKFPKRRPAWLVNDRGNQMELDGYCQELGLAFEFNGRQHYEVIEYFKMTSETLKVRQKDDTKKKLLCRQNNVILVIIKQTLCKSNINDFKKVIINECKNNNINIVKKIDYDIYHKIYTRRFNVYNTDSFIDIAKQRGGELLSPEYIHYNLKLEWRCKEGHIWKQRPSNILAGSWCNLCAIKNKSSRVSIEQARDVARKKGGECLSNGNIYINDKLLWRCHLGHEWGSIYAYIKNSKSWCPTCRKEIGMPNRRTHSIEEMKEIAVKRDGLCLSETYKNTKKKLLWECSQGHTWWQNYNNIYNGTWCPKCARQKRRSAS